MRVVRQLSAYFTGNALTTLASLISFPLFTRMLTPADYGMMSLVNLTLVLVVALSKAGLQHALVREWDPTSAGNDQSNRAVATTTFYATLFFSLAVCGLLALIVAIADLSGKHPASWTLLAIVTAMTLPDVARTIFTGKLRVMQKAFLFNAVLVVHKYAQILLALAFMLVFHRNIYNFFAGMIAASLIVSLALAVRERAVLSPRFFDRRLVKPMLIFGLPMVVYELSAITLTFIDRYFLGYFCGAETVGLYSSAYNLAFFIQTLVQTTVTSTFFSMVTEKLKTDGEAACRVFIQESLLWFLLVTAAISCGFIALAPDLLILAASAKYAPAAVIFAPVTIAGWCFGLFSVAMGELFVARRTLTMAIMIGLAALFNMLLNLLLIPRYGMLGAAWSGMIPQMALAAYGMERLQMWTSPRLLWRMLVAAVPALIMYGAILVMPSTTTWPSVFLRCTVGSLVWMTMAWLTNAELRHYIRGNLSTSKGRFPSRRNN